MKDDSLEHRERLAAEAEFHNRRFAEEEGRSQDRYYGAINHGLFAYLDKVVAAARGARVLELGCAKGVRSVTIAEVADELVGVDISSVAIGMARERVDGAGLHNVAFSVMDAHQLALPDQAFDLVFGSGIIHHLDLDRCFRELSRVLRPGGQAIFMEPLGHNPMINLYRRMTPEARTPDEHPLLRRDFRDAKRHFAAIDLDFYGFTTLAAVSFRREAVQKPLLKLGIALDWALARVPGIRWAFWHCCMTMRKAP